MRASTARLMNSPVRLADLTFPQVNRLIHRTRLAFIHLDNLLAFGKRDRDGRVDGRFVGGYYCDKPDEQPVGQFFETQFHAASGGAAPAISAVLFPAAAELPQQAPNALINTYRELYWRIVDEVEKEFPGEAKRRAQKVSAGILEQHKAIGILSAPRGTETPDAVVQPEELAAALMDWSRQLLQGVEVIMPGTPAVSDPGAVLVAAARERDVPIVTVPGPTAVAAALAVSGLSADRYLFLGFLPRKGGERRRLLDTVAKSEWTVVLFEAPPRVAELLLDLAAACGGGRRAAVARELTKVFEETRAGTLTELAGYYAEAPARGEVTVVVAGSGKPVREERPPDPEARARALLAQGLTRKGVGDRIADETGIARNTAYRLVNEL